MNRKKFFIIALIAFACIVALVALVALPKSGKKGGKFSVVTTIFPLYDWTREVGAGNEEIEYTLILNSGSDMHSFQPSVKDIAKISSADLFIYVGGESDRWVDDLLRTAAGKKLKAVNLMEFLSSRIRCTDCTRSRMREVTISTVPMRTGSPSSIPSYSRYGKLQTPSPNC